MNCETFASLLSRLWDGELSPGEEEALRLHAASCPRCAQLLAVWEDARDALAHLDDGVQPPEAFSQGWRDAVRREAFRAKRMRRRPFLRAASGLAAAIVLLAGSTALWREGMLPVAYPDGVRVEASAAPDVQEPGLRPPQSRHRSRARSSRTLPACAAQCCRGRWARWPRRSSQD